MLKSSDAARPKAAGAKGSAVDKPAALVEGAKAPDFRLPRDGGNSVALSDFSGKKLVLFFYPRADTPGCTREAIDFTRLASDFAASGTAVLGHFSGFAEGPGIIPRQAQAFGSSDFR